MPSRPVALVPVVHHDRPSHVFYSCLNWEVIRTLVLLFLGELGAMQECPGVAYFAGGSINKAGS